MESITKTDKINLVLYTSIAYGITWSILFLLIFFYSNLDLYLREIWHSFGAIGPTIASLFVLRRMDEEKNLNWLRKGILRVPELKLIVFAFIPLLILMFFLIFEASLGISNIYEVFRENSVTDFISLLLLFLPSIFYGFFEEIGWRGYLLPKLQNYCNALKATLILTIIWYFWHLPMFFYRFELFFAIFLMFPLMLSGSIIFTFLFNESGGSILMVIILHICYDIVSASGLSILAVPFVSVFFIVMDIRAIKIFGFESLSHEEKLII